MGIGNTTAASAVTATMTGSPAGAHHRAGNRAARSEELRRKVEVVRRGATPATRPIPDDPLGVLARVGGFEIGVLAGVVLGERPAGAAP